MAQQEDVDVLDRLTALVLSEEQIQSNNQFALSIFISPLPIPAISLRTTSNPWKHHSSRTFDETYFHPNDWVQCGEVPFIISASANRKRDSERCCDVHSLQFLLRRALQYPHLYRSRLLKIENVLKMSLRSFFNLHQVDFSTLPHHLISFFESDRDQAFCDEYHLRSSDLLMSDPAADPDDRLFACTSRYPALLSAPWEVDSNHEFHVHFHHFKFEKFDAAIEHCLPSRLHGTASQFLLLSAKRIPFEHLPVVQIYPTADSSIVSPIIWKYVGCTKLSDKLLHLLAKFHIDFFFPSFRSSDNIQEFYQNQRVQIPELNEIDDFSSAGVSEDHGFAADFPTPEQFVLNLQSSLSCSSLSSSSHLENHELTGNFKRYLIAPCVHLPHSAPAVVSVDFPFRVPEIPSNIDGIANLIDWSSVCQVSAFSNCPIVNLLPPEILGWMDDEPSSPPIDVVQFCIDRHCERQIQNLKRQNPDSTLPDPNQVNFENLQDSTLQPTKRFKSSIVSTGTSSATEIDLSENIAHSENVFQANSNANSSSMTTVIESENWIKANAIVQRNLPAWQHIFSLLCNRLLVTLYNSTPYFIHSLTSHMNPLSHFENGSPEYFQSYLLRRQQIWVKTGQPLFLCTLCDLRTKRMFLHPVTLHKRRDVNLVPETCGVSSMPLALHKASQYLPSILWKTERNLAVWEISHYFAHLHDDNSASNQHFTLPHSLNVPPPFWTILSAALTSPNGECNPRDNYERLEYLGDCAIKYVIGATLFFHFPTLSERELSELRGLFCSNLVFALLSNKHGLAGASVMGKFQPRLWLRPGLPLRLWGEHISKITECVSAEAGISIEQQIEVTPPDIRQYCSFKTTADYFESVFGACLTGFGIDVARSLLNRFDLNRINISTINQIVQDHGSTSCFHFLQVFGIKTENFIGKLNANNVFRILEESGPLNFHQQFWNSSVKSMFDAFQDPNHCFQLQPDQIVQIEELLDYQFVNCRILNEALLKNSNYHFSGICFERLEYLGDAVIDYLITCSLLAEFGDEGPGNLTIRRQSLVSNSRFAEIVDAMGILSVCVPDWYLLSQHSSNSSTSSSPSKPKFGAFALGAIFEALVGAVFLDSELSLPQVWRVFGRWLHYDRARVFHSLQEVLQNVKSDF